MRTVRPHSTFIFWIVVALALFSGCDQAPAEQETPAPSRAAADGMAQKPAEAPAQPGMGGK